MGAPIIAIFGALAIAANPAWPASDPALPPSALSDVESMPDDPEYAPSAECTGQLGLYSFTPACAAAIAESGRELGTGIRADRAWLWTIGRGEIAIAIADGGSDWADVELVSRVRLNAGELPAPQTSTAAPSAHDRNGDGAFTVLDYTSATGTVAPSIALVVDVALARRTDRGDANGNGILDPGDLIAIYSNGIDEDANGYTDDIAGWDFVDDDNDVAVTNADPSFARAAVAVANNGIAGAGACPRCAMIPLRVAIRGLAAGNNLGASIIYAADSGARVLATAVSAAGGSTLIDRAVAYAYSKGTGIVAGAGNAASARREVLWDPSRVAIVGSIGFDRAKVTEATTAIAPDPCSNRGAQLAAVAPGRCDENAAAITAGAVGLVLSASLGIPAKNVPALSLPLSSGEALQLITANATELDDARPGRVDARAAIDAVIQRRIPPETRIVSPDWFTIIDPTRGGGFAVTARVENRRYAHASWVLEYALGVAPEPTAFAPLASGRVEAGAIADVSAMVPTEGLFRDTSAPPANDGDFAVTLRLTSTAGDGGDVARAETRRTVFVHRDLDLLPGFPRALGAGVAGSPRIVDLDGDGTTELVVGTDDGRIFVIDASGKDVPGWPVTLPAWPFLDPTRPNNHAGAPAYASGSVARDVQESLLATPSVALMSSAARASTVIAAGNGGSIVAFDPRGVEVGAVISAGGGFFDEAPAGHASGPVLADLDGDSMLDVVVASASGELHARKTSGESLAGFPVMLPEPCGAPAIGDLDGDDRPDLVLASEEAIYVVKGGIVSTLELPGARDDVLPARGLEAMHLPAPALADVDGDGVLDIAIALRGRAVIAMRASGGAPIFAAASNRQAFGVRSRALRAGDVVLATGAPVAIADLDRDGILELAAPIAGVESFGRLDPEHEAERFASAWSVADGSFTSGSPHEIGAASLDGPVIADLDGDERPEVIIGGSDFALDAFSSEGSEPRHWPKLTGGWVIGAPATGDLDRDGNTDVVAVTRDGLVFAWRGRALKESTEAWPSFRHDDRATANVETPTILVKLAHLEAACACAFTAGARSEVGAFFVTLLVAWAARRNAHRNRDRSR